MPNLKCNIHLSKKADNRIFYLRVIDSASLCLTYTQTPQSFLFLCANQRPRRKTPINVSEIDKPNIKPEIKS